MGGMTNLMEEPKTDEVCEIFPGATVTVIGPCPACGAPLNPRSPDRSAMWSPDLDAFVCRPCGEAAKNEA